MNTQNGIGEGSGAMPCSTSIPPNVYFSVVQQVFYSSISLTRRNDKFHAEWLPRANEFPSSWEIKDEQDRTRGCEVAHSEDEAIGIYAAKRELSDLRGLFNWRAYRM